MFDRTDKGFWWDRPLTLGGQEWLQVPEVRMVMSKQADWRG